MSDRFHVSDCGCLDCRLKVEQIKQARRNSADIVKLESEHAEMLALLRRWTTFAPGEAFNLEVETKSLLARTDGATP